MRKATQDDLRNLRLLGSHEAAERFAALTHLFTPAPDSIGLSWFHEVFVHSARSNLMSRNVIGYQDEEDVAQLVILKFTDQLSKEKMPFNKESSLWKWVSTVVPQVVGDWVKKERGTSAARELEETKRALTAIRKQLLVISSDLTTDIPRDLSSKRGMARLDQNLIARTIEWMLSDSPEPAPSDPKSVKVIVHGSVAMAEDRANQVRGDGVKKVNLPEWARELLTDHPMKMLVDRIPTVDSILRDSELIDPADPLVNEMMRKIRETVQRPKLEPFSYIDPSSGEEREREIPDNDRPLTCIEEKDEAREMVLAFAGVCEAKAAEEVDEPFGMRATLLSFSAWCAAGAFEHDSPMTALQILSDLINSDVGYHDALRTWTIDHKKAFPATWSPQTAAALYKGLERFRHWMAGQQDLIETGLKAQGAVDAWLECEIARGDR